MSNTDKEPIIVLESVDKFFGPFQALKDINLTVEIVAKLSLMVMN